MSDEYLEEYDKKRVLDNPDAKPGRNINRKRQLQRYNAFKDDIRKIVAEKNFVMPHGYFAIWFYMPIPKSWRRGKITEKLYTVHQSTPDCDNMIKAFLDGVMPRKNKAKGQKGVDDRKVHCYAAFKMWVRPEEACIKVIEYEDIEFMRVFQHGLPYHSVADHQE